MVVRLPCISTKRNWEYGTTSAIGLSGLFKRSRYSISQVKGIPVGANNTAYRCGKSITINFAETVDLSPWTYTNIGSVEDGLRPMNSVASVVTDGSHVILASVNPDGNVTLNPFGVSVTKASKIYGSLSYISM